MIRNTGFIFLSALLLCFCACKKSGSIEINPAPDSVKIKQTLIIGEWQLQKQTLLSYVNGLPQSDTTCVATDSTANFTKFNKDSTFTSVSSKNVVNVLSPSAISIGVGGKYSISKSVFNLSPSVIGLDFSLNGGFTTGTVTNSPLITLVYHAVNITRITATTLVLHTVDIYTETVNSVSTAYKNIQNFYYTK
jgi:hypothetical protein